MKGEVTYKEIEEIIFHDVERIRIKPYASKTGAGYVSIKFGDTEISLLNQRGTPQIIIGDDDEEG